MPEAPSWFVQQHEALKKAKLEERAAFERAKEEGDIPTLEQYFKAHEDCGHLNNDKKEIVTGLISNPKGRANALAVFEATTATNFDFEKLFESSMFLEGDLWNVYARESTPDTAKIGAIMMAEYIRFKVVRDGNYKFDFDSIMKTAKQPDGLSGEAHKTALQNSILAVQHALVDYVQKDANGLVAHRGAAFLSIMGSDLPKDALALTSQTMTGFNTRRLESLRAETVKFEPVYEPHI